MKHEYLFGAARAHTVTQPRDVVALFLYFDLNFSLRFLLLSQNVLFEG